MMRIYRPIALTFAALALAGLAAGCSADTVKEMPKGSGPLSPPATGQPLVQPAQPQELDASQVPEELLTWSNTQKGAPAPAAKVVVTSDAVYVGLSGGQRPSGGYTVKLTGSLQREGDGWLADAQVVPPAPGTMVTEAITTPVAFYKLPKVAGAIQVRFAPSTHPNAPPATPPATPPSTPPGTATPRGQVSSDNFRVNSPRLLSDGKLFLEGTARAFEAVFQVQVWSGGKLLLTQPVHAAAGAPEYGRFEVTLTVPGGVPAGAEVRYQIPSMKDGSVKTELTLPVSK